MDAHALSAPNIKDSDFSMLISRGESMAGAAGTNRAGLRFPSDPSFIGVESKPAIPGTGILVVDVGGTHVKVGLRHTAPNGQISWKELLDLDNNALNTHCSSGKRLEQMTFELSRQIVAKLERNGTSRSGITGVGVVWSNQLSSSPLPDSGKARGVTGEVSGSKEGKAYRKGEWWNADIMDGDNVGEIFLQAFGRHGLNPRAFVIGNDTIFTCKAIDDADSGMVASTGANATIIPAGQRMLCNSESGGNFELERRLIGLPERSEQPLLKLEDVMAGKNMPGLYAEYLIQAAAHGAEDLKPLAESLTEKIATGANAYSSQDISFILAGKYDEFLGGRNTHCYGPKTLAAMKAIAARLISISGRFAAAMAYFSIYNQLAEKDHFVIALDSSQARFQLGYLDSMRSALAGLLAPRGRKADIQLLEPEGEISVPMIGVARAANDFL